MEIKSTLNIDGALNYLNSLIINAPPISFAIVNTAIDEAAKNPEYRIYYFAAVDEGRVGFVAQGLSTNSIGKTITDLHFKLSATDWVVVHEVGPSKPLRITDKAQAKINAGINQVIIDSIATHGGRSNLAKDIEDFFINSYREATMESTALYDVKAEFYGVVSTPLADSFKIIRT
jgi:hypothetical protein